MVKIREYRSEDCGGMAELFYETVHTVNRKDYSPEQLDAWADGRVDPGQWDRSFLEHDTLVAEENGRILGFADMDAEGYLDRLYVHSARQGEGIASALCSRLEQRHREQTAGESLFTTHASVTARPFFEKRGYRVVREQQVERKGIRLTNYVMEKRAERKEAGMKVLLLNGSPRGKGCTYTALKEVADTLEAQGIETEIIGVGQQTVRGCIGCGVCRKTGRCFVEDPVNTVLEKMEAADGLVVGSPVYYAAASGQITSFLDRLFYAGGGRFDGKPGAAVVSCRRGGAASAFDQLNKYFMISNMPVVSSQYWNQVHGNTPEEVRQDLEGMQTMRTLANNMAWLLKCIECGEKYGIQKPVREAKIPTNFIR